MQNSSDLGVKIVLKSVLQNQFITTILIEKEIILLRILKHFKSIKKYKFD